MTARLAACLLFFLSLSLPHISLAQERCSTVAYESLLHGQARQTREARLESWLQQKLQEKKSSNRFNRLQSGTYTIPVVVHIIHNGEAIGTGSNLSDAQIQSQIQVINDDFQRLNADQTNTPTEFQSVAGSIDLHFVLAKQDPEGLATTGIVRAQGTKTSWTLAEYNTLKAISYWPAEDYLNIWVTTMTGGIIGYAQLPEPASTGLQGLADASEDRLTDGVVVNYTDFGTIDAGPFNLDAAFNKGRTATHEIGHYFGLRHIWGDAAGCATDYVADTPPQSSATGGCPTNPVTSCSGHKMFQNYMDYTNDACMNLFTQGQASRMEIILQNSPRRASLLTSHGLLNPVTFTTDAGIRKLVNPMGAVCAGSFTPQFELRNYGSATITAVQAQLQIDGNSVETKNFSGLSLATLAAQTFSFSALTASAGTNHTLTIQILSTNGTTDQGTANNTLTTTYTVASQTSLPILEPFNSQPSNWEVKNPDGLTTWGNIVAPDASATNRSMYMNLSAYENYGTTDWLLSPSFSLNTPITTQLKFDVAYAQYPGETGDKLSVYLLPACSRDLTSAILLYSKSGSTLATASSTSQPFTPSSDNQWRKSEQVSLAGISSAVPYQLAFVSTNGYGNNLYIDNIILTDQIINDVAVISVDNPGLVTCVTQPLIRFTVKNFSSSPITNFKASRTLNGGAAVVQNFTGISMAPGEQAQYTLNATSLLTGKNEITISAYDPNGVTDSSPGNNTVTFNTYLNQNTDLSPARTTFDRSSEVPWVFASEPGEMDWLTATTNKGNSAKYPSYTNTSKDAEAWLVSPTMNLSNQAKSSLLFDLSYGLRSAGTERLRVLASDNCGYSWDYTLLDLQGSSFSVAPSESEWLPSIETDWTRQYVNLSTLSGKSLVRLAIVVTNQNGNNVYVDNIEFYAGDDISPPITTAPYQFYFPSDYNQGQLAMTFNLDQRQDVHLQVYSMDGRLMNDEQLPDILNQTYYYSLGSAPEGIYLFRVQIGQDVRTSKVFISH